VVTLDDIRAAMVIRVWFEGGTDHFRGRLTTADTSPGSLDTGESTFALASSPSDVVDAVSKWLDDVVHHASQPIDTEEQPPNHS
jgi:hypothetical protein